MILRIHLLHANSRSQLLSPLVKRTRLPSAHLGMKSSFFHLIISSYTRCLRGRTQRKCILSVPGLTQQSHKIKEKPYSVVVNPLSQAVLAWIPASVPDFYYEHLDPRATLVSK